MEGGEERKGKSALVYLFFRRLFFSAFAGNRESALVENAHSHQSECTEYCTVPGEVTVARAPTVDKPGTDQLPSSLPTAG